MGNTYGILLITVLMGNGLVGLPRRMWYYADPEMELNWLYMMVYNRQYRFIIINVLFIYLFMYFVRIILC